MTIHELPQKMPAANMFKYSLQRLPLTLQVALDWWHLITKRVGTRVFPITVCDRNKRSAYITPALSVAQKWPTKVKPIPPVVKPRQAASIASHRGFPHPDALIADLQATRTALAEHGRCQLTLIQRSDRKVCLSGAIGMVTLPNFEIIEAADPTKLLAYRALTKSPRATAVMKAIYPHVKDRLVDMASPPTTVAKAARGDMVKAMWVFNDMTRATDTDVFDALEKALAQARATRQPNPRDRARTADHRATPKLHTRNT